MLTRVVTNSERGSSACDRRWAFRYNEGIAPAAESPAALRQGSLVHRLLDVWYRAGCPDLGDAGAMYQAIIEPWLEQRREYANQAEREYAQKLHAENMEIAAESWGMFAHYVQTYAERDRDEWEILAVGPQVGRWLVHPVSGGSILDRPSAALKAQGALPGVQTGAKTWRRWAQGGELDLLVRERSTGLVWIVEHKTTADRDLVKYLRKLRLDPQIRAYAWLLRDPIPELSDEAVRQPIEVAGVIYNVLRKAVPREPEPLAVPKPTKATPNPVSPGLSRDKRIDTTRAVYLAAILRHGLDPDDYIDLLSELAQRKFFARDRYVLGEGDLLDWQTDAGWWALGRIEEQRKPFHPRQTAICTGPAAMQCPYSRICLEDGAQVRIGYQLRSVRHEELRGSLSDPWPITEERRKSANLLPILGQIGSVHEAAQTAPEWASDDDPFR